MKYSKISFKNTVVAIQRWRSSEVTLRTRNIIGIEEWKLGSALAENIFWHWFKHAASNLRFKWYFYTGIQGAPSSRMMNSYLWIHRCFFLSRVFSHTEFSQFMHRFKDFGSQNFHPTIRLKWSYQKFREGTIYYK